VLLFHFHFHFHCRRSISKSTAMAEAIYLATLPVRDPIALALTTRLNRNHGEARYRDSRKDWFHRIDPEC
jgi:hypothetical protein